MNAPRVQYTLTLSFVMDRLQPGSISGIINNADFLSIVHHPTTAVMGIIVSYTIEAVSLAQRWPS